MAKMEDVWDDASEEPLDKDTRVHLSHLFTDGFRTGVALAQEEKVQTGFDTGMLFQQLPRRDEARLYTGYSEGMREGMRWGTYQGILIMYQAIASKGETPVAFPELDKAVELAKSIKPEDAYNSIYHRLVEAKQADLNASREVSVLPERIEKGKEIHEEMAQLQKMVERWKEKRGSLADRSSNE